MHRFKLIALAVTVVAALAAPASSFAQGAAPDQYQEQIPTVGGNDPSGGLGGSTSGSGGGSSSSAGGGATGGAAGSGAGVGGKSGGGADGDAANNLAKGTSPGTAELRDAAQGGGSGLPTSNVFGSAADDDGSGDGLGVILVAVLAGTALAGGGYWYWRSRQSHAARVPGDGSPTHV